MIKKILISVFLIFFSLEFLSYLYYDHYHNGSNGFLIKRPNNVEKENCQLFLFDYGLDSIYNDRYKCDKIDGYHKENIIYYKNKNNDDNIILTLGGSTTNGRYFQKKENGDEYIMWPFFLNKNCENDSDCKIINGGHPAYSSRDERKKLIRSILTLEKLPKVVISLSGINDVRNIQQPLEIKYPYQPLNSTILLFEQKSLGQKVIYFPATLRLLRSLINYFVDYNFFNAEERILTSKVYKDYDLSLPKNTQYDSADLWLLNTKMSQSIAKEFDIKYLIFLQPTLGLDAYSNTKISNDDRIKLKSIPSKNYLKDLNFSYNKLKKFCASLDYCYDISEIFLNNKERLYFDYRHTNQLGSRIIAEEIFETLRMLSYIK